MLRSMSHFGPAINLGLLQNLWHGRSMNIRDPKTHTNDEKQPYANTYLGGIFIRCLKVSSFTDLSYLFFLSPARGYVAFAALHISSFNFFPGNLFLKLLCRCWTKNIWSTLLGFHEIIFF